MTDTMTADEIVTEAFRAFDEWLATWHEAHPDDTRYDYELAHVYFEEVTHE